MSVEVTASRSAAPRRLASAGPGRQAVSASRSARLLFVLVALAVGWITLVPLGMLLFSTVAAGENRLPIEAATLTLDNYVRLLEQADTYRLLLNTAVFTIGSTLLGLGVAILFAWAIERTDVWLRRCFVVAILIPMAIPNMIYAMAWMQLLGPNNGLLVTLLQQWRLGFLAPDILSLGGMIFVQGIALASHAYLLVAPPFRMIDPSWEEQSQIAGGRTLRTLRRITLPVLKPALLAAMVFFAVVSMETFDIPVMLGLSSHVHVMSTQIYWVTHPEGGGLPDYGMASVLSLVLLAVALVLIRFYQRQTANARQFVTITGRGYRPRRLALGVWRWPLFLFMAGFVVVSVGLPLFMLVWRSLLRFYMFPSARALAQVSLAAYAQIADDLDLASVLSNTAVMALTAGCGTVALAALVAWLVTRAPVPAVWRRRLTLLAFLPQAVPSIVIGLALMLVYLSVPVPIYGTVWIIALGMTTKYLSYSTGIVAAAQMQVSGELEEASQITGAGWWRTYRRIVLPLVAPALVSCLLWVILHAVRELGLSLMLYSLDSQVLSTKIWLLWEGGGVAEACAIGVLTVLGLVTLLFVPWAVMGLRRMRGRWWKASVAGAGLRS